MVSFFMNWNCFDLWLICDKKVVMCRCVLILNFFIVVLRGFKNNDVCVEVGMMCWSWGSVRIILVFLYWLYDGCGRFIY